MPQFDEDNQPKERKPRGKSERTKILEAMKRESKTEDGFYDLMVRKAHESEDNFSFGEMLKRLSPIPKQTMPYIQIDYPEKGTLIERAAAIELAIVTGKIPPDVGLSFLSGLGVVAKTEEVTELAARIKKLEEILNK